MKKTVKTELFRVTAIILILAMTLCGCGKHDKTSNTKTDDTKITDTVKPGDRASDKPDGIKAADKDEDSSPVINSADIVAAESEETEAADEEPAYVSDIAASAYSKTGDFGLKAEGGEWATDDWDVYECVKPSADWDVGSFDIVEPGMIGDWDFYTDDPIVIDDPVIDIPIVDDIIIDPEPTVAPRAGLLTAGEWNDNKNMYFLRNLLANGQEQNYMDYFTAWNLRPFNRIVVHVTGADGSDIRNAKTIAYNADGTLLARACTDNHGMAYIFYNLNGGTTGIPARIQVVYGDLEFDYEVTSADLMDDSIAEVSYPVEIGGSSKQLDLMMVIDTTGSMGDEISYLQVELENVIERVSRNNANLPIRLSVNFYRDLDDDYIVNSYPFSSNIDDEMSYLRVEYASGGGDYEEAVELALEDAVNAHDWNSDSIKLMFLVLDAPPHNTDEIKASLASTLADAAAKGIRIIPVASSGVDKSTEFLLRTFAMVTGGTYTFLTDHSGIGGSHIEPTIGSYDVEYLNDLMVRIIDGYLE